MNHPLLEKWNCHVAAGDVLLLSSRGLESLAIKTYQAVKRRLIGNYTHVAVVVGPDMIVDAMPKNGVSFTRWRDIEGGYDLERCRVARNTKLASNVETHQRLHQRAVYYFKQRYTLETLFSPPESYADQAGLACSQFVALLLQDLGIKASTRPVLDTLPVDIDQATQIPPDWRQFSLTDYGLCSKCPEHPPRGYTDDVLKASPVELSDEDLKEARRIADSLATKEGLEAFSARSVAMVARSELLQNEVAAKLRSSMQAAYEASASLRDLDDLMTRFLQLAAENKLSQADLSALLAKMQGPHATIANPLSGDSLLSVYKWLFLDFEIPDAAFMHATGAPDNHVARCTIFRKTLTTQRDRVNTHMQEVDALLTEVQKLGPMSERGDPIDPLFLRKLRSSAVQLFLRGEQLMADETLEAVQQRNNDHPLLVEELKARLESPKMETRIKEDAIECLLIIRRLDMHREWWLGSLRSAVATIAKSTEAYESQLNHLSNSGANEAKNK